MSTNEKAISWKEQGDDYFKQGKYDIAIKSYAEALKIDPDYIGALNNMGFAYSKIGKREDATKCKNRIKIIKETKNVQAISTSQAPQIIHTSKKITGLALLLSLVFPGLGQVYNGEIRKGFFILIGIILGIFSFIIPGIIVWLYSIYDSYTIAHQMNLGVIPTKSISFGQILKYVVISCIVLTFALITFGYLLTVFESESTIITVIFLLLFICVIIFYLPTKKVIPPHLEKTQPPLHQQVTEDISQATAVPKYQYHPEEVIRPQAEDFSEIVPAQIISKQGLNWAGLGQSITVGGYTLLNPLIYWSDGEAPSSEASCIDIRKPVGNNSQAELLPYWPRYSGLTPNQRGHYLSWLSRGKTDDSDEIGYMFIYFYGLERRALVEQADFDSILTECLRLLSTFSNSKSFTSYVSGFMAFLLGSRLNHVANQEMIQYVPAFDNLPPKMMDVILSWHYTRNIPIPWELAYSLAVYSSNAARTPLVKKSPDLVKTLFKRKFLHHFPDGFPLNDMHTPRRLDYHPASPSLLTYYSNPAAPGNIPEITIQIPELNQFDEIFSIWTDCVEELKPVSNRLNKTDGKVTRDVYAVFPVELKQEIVHPDKQIWYDLIRIKESGSGGSLVKISEIAQLVGIEKRDTLTPKQCGDLVNTASDVGLTVIPNLFVLGTSYKWNDSVALLENHDSHNQLSENIEKVSLIFEMAYAIATQDGIFSEAEQEFLYDSLTDRFQLHNTDIRYLKTLQSVLEIQAPPISRIGKRLTNHLNIDQKLTLAHFLSKIISLETQSEKEERKILKTVYKSLDIEPSLAEASINRIISEKSWEEPVSVSKPKISRTGEVIPTEVPRRGITIDEMKLMKKIQETMDVKFILGKIFEKEQEEAESQEFSAVSSNGEGSDRASVVIHETLYHFPHDSLNHLDAKYIPILNEIMTSKEYSKEDFSNLARKHNLMPQAVLDEINTWADEELGDFLLIERENGLVVNYDSQ